MMAAHLLFHGVGSGVIVAEGAQQTAAGVAGEAGADV